MLTGCGPVIYKALPMAYALEEWNLCSLYIADATLDRLIKKRIDSRGKIKQSKEERISQKLSTLRVMYMLFSHSV